MATRITISRIGQRIKPLVVDALNLEQQSTTVITASGAAQNTPAAPNDASNQFGVYIQTDEAIWVTGGIDAVATANNGFYLAAGDRQPARCPW